MILQVQRQWMYLENIFLGEDIRKQLPKESAEFDGLNADWKEIMTELNKDPNARFISITCENIFQILT